MANTDPERNPHLVIVNGTIGDMAAQTIANPQSNYWTLVDQRPQQGGGSPRQVAVIWMYEVIPGELGVFPEDARKLQHYLLDSLHNAIDRYPDLKIAYLSSRDYGGYTEVGESPEPFAYQTAFAVKWLIADHITWKAALNFDPAKGRVRTPWIAWKQDESSSGRSSSIFGTIRNLARPAM